MEEIAFTGVPVACKSAELATNVLSMVLDTVARRRSSAGLMDQLAQLQQAARVESECLARSVAADGAAYQAYVEARRAKNPAEITRCQRAIVEVPMQAARSALAVLDICVKTRPLATGSIAADLSVAEILLVASARSILVCVRENLNAAPDADSAAEFETEFATLTARANSPQSSTRP